MIEGKYGQFILNIITIYNICRFQKVFANYPFTINQFLQKMNLFHSRIDKILPKQNKV